jgi:hypothetical protein
MNGFPRRLDELNCEWLAEVLGREVSRFSAQSLGEGVGVIGQVSRLSLITETGPFSVIAKFPSEVPENRSVGELYDMYGKEYRFYSDIAPRIPLRVPDCYHASYDPDNHDFVLLLEDLDHYQVGDQVKGCSISETELVTKALASLHASTWQIADIDGLVCHDNPAQCEGMIAGFNLGWPIVLERYGQLVPTSAREIAEKMPAAIPKLLNAMCQAPVCLSQGDCRLDNIFFGDSEVAIIDWQAISSSAPEHDLAYFITQSLDQETFEARDWVSIYHSELEKLGIDYPLEFCQQRFRVCALYLLCYAVVIAGTLDMSNKRGEALAKTLLSNSLRSLDSMNAFQLLD